MTVTEEEAKKKWCPETRWYGNVNYVLTNRDSGNSQQRCVASGCMMWRWFSPAQYDGFAEGYCGKGGKI